METHRRSHGAAKSYPHQGALAQFLKMGAASSVGFSDRRRDPFAARGPSHARLPPHGIEVPIEWDYAAAQERPHGRAQKRG